MKKIRSFFLMFIFMNVAVFNATIALNSEDESGGITKHAPFKKLDFYQQIKHLFPKKFENFSKNNWKDLTREIYRIYCLDKIKAYDSLRSVLKKIQNEESVDSIHKECLKKLEIAATHLSYYQNKEKKQQAHSKDNNKKIENTDSRDNFSSKVPAKTFKCTSFTRKDEEFITLIKSILPEDTSIETKKVWNQSARQLLKASHFKGIRPLQDYLRELSKLIKDPDLIACIKQLNSGVTRVKNLSLEDKEPYVSINKVKKSNDDSNKKRKKSTSNAPERSISSTAITSDQSNKKANVASTSEVKAFNFTLEDIEPLFPNDLMNSSDFEWDEIASSIFDFYKLDEKNTHLELYFAFFKLKKNTTVKKNIDALQKLMDASKRLKNLSHTIAKLLPFSDLNLLDLDASKNEESEEESLPTTPTLDFYAEESEEEYIPKTPILEESYYDSFEAVEYDSKKDQFLDNTDQGNIEIVEIFENCDQSFQNNLEIPIDNNISSPLSLTFESPCHNNIVEKSHPQNKRNRNEYDDLEDNNSSKKQCTDEEYIKNLISDGKNFLQHEDFEKAISCFEKVLCFKNDPLLESFVMDAYILIAEANCTFIAYNFTHKNISDLKMKYSSECCLLVLEKINNNNRQKYLNIYVRTLICLGKIERIFYLDLKIFSKHIKERYGLPLITCFFIDALDALQYSENSSLHIQAFLGMAEAVKHNRSNVTHYSEYKDKINYSNQVNIKRFTQYGDLANSNNYYDVSPWYLSVLDLCTESDHLYRIQALIGLGNTINKDGKYIEKHTNYPASYGSIAWYYEALDLLNKKECNAYKIQALMGTGNCFFNYDPKKSIYYYKEAILLNPSPRICIRALTAIANAWCRLRNYAEAIRSYKKVEDEILLLDENIQRSLSIKKISLDVKKRLEFCERNNEIL
ncbi:MAG: hypothetical protein Q8L85_02110 [Alphaproteobacteria bacterium]|nr:hypothetical protein [Alphaproteobacteria bacterium]